MKNDAASGRTAGQTDKQGKPEQVILHDLFHKTKNPLQIILSAVNILEENPPQEERENLYGIIRDNSYKINEILNTLAAFNEKVDMYKTTRSGKNGG